MTTMGDKVFLDTNVLLRASFSGMEDHVTCRLCVEYLLASSGLWLSNQVVREFYRQARRSEVVKEGLSRMKTVRIIRSALLRFNIAEENQAVHECLLLLLEDDSVNVSGPLIHDANIVATMLAHDIGTLVSRDGDFQRFRNQIRILSPAGVLP